VTANRLSGPLPPGYGQLLSLKELHMGTNNFDGPLPEAWSGLDRLKIVDLSGNRLSGELVCIFGK